MYKVALLAFAIAAVQAINIQEKSDTRIFDTNFVPLGADDLERLLLGADLPTKGFEEIFSNSTVETTNNVRTKFEEKHTVTYRKAISCVSVLEGVAMLKALLPELISDSTHRAVQSHFEKNWRSVPGVCFVGLEMHLDAPVGSCASPKQRLRRRSKCGVCTSNCIVIGRRENVLDSY